MPELKGTKTEQNLLKSFAGESQARNRYTFFAEMAIDEGYEQIAEIFEETAYNEKVHADIFFSFLEGGDLEITATYPAGKVGTTAENLKAAAMGEREEWTVLYPEFARIAEEEGFPKIAVAWKMISKVEKKHEERYSTLFKSVEEEKVFAKDSAVEWKCRECGYVHSGVKAPGKCPVCFVEQSAFEVRAKNY
ncbi:MAG TPA: rubrerythrin family protein [Clostridia bacterium]|nr:rubrerythrin family protein [Clostridia bacterium]